MVKIPETRSIAQLPGARTPVMTNSAIEGGAVASAISDVGKTLLSLNDRINSVRQQRSSEISAFQKAERKRTSNNLATNDKIKLLQLKNEIAQGRFNTTAWPDSYLSKAKDIIEERRQEVSGEVLADYEKVINHQIVLDYKDLMDKSRAAEMSAGYSDLQNNIKYNLTLYRENDSLEEKQNILGSVFADITEAVNVGYINAKEEEDMKNDFLSDVYRADAWDVAESLGYEKGIEYLADFDNYPDLPKEERNDMIGKLKLMRDQDKRRYEDEQKEKQREAVKLLGEGQLSENWVELNIDDPEKQMEWKKRITDREKAIATRKEDEYYRTDPLLYESHWEKALRGEFDETKAISSLGKGLTTTHIEHFIDLNNKANEPEEQEKNKLLQDALDRGKRAILGVTAYELAMQGLDSGTEYQPDPSAPERFYRFHRALERRIENGIAEGKTAQSMLVPTGKDYMLDSLIQEFKLEPIKELRKKAEIIRNRLNKPPRAEQVHAKPGESIPEYLKRTR